MTIDLNSLILLPWKTTIAYLHGSYVMGRKIDFNDKAVKAWRAQHNQFSFYLCRTDSSYRLCVFDASYGDLPILTDDSNDLADIVDRIVVDMTERRAKTVGHLSAGLDDLRAATFRPGQRIMIAAKDGDYYATVVDKNIIVDNIGAKSNLPNNITDVYVVEDVIGVNCNDIDYSWSRMVLGLYTNDDCDLIESIYDHVVDHTTVREFQGKSRSYRIYRTKNFR